MPVVVEGLIPDSHFRDILYQSKCVHLTLNSHYSPPHQPLILPPQKHHPLPNLKTCLKLSYLQNFNLQKKNDFSNIYQNVANILKVDRPCPVCWESLELFSF